MRTGLFGGTFNPVHSGHVMIATDILGSFPLDHIIVVPAAVPPHKPSDFMADISLRLEMTRLAYADLDQCTVSDIEAERGGRSFSIDTVFYFLDTAAEDDELYFMVGLDAFLELDTWKDYMKLIEIIPFIVIQRPLAEQSAQASMASFLKEKISSGYVFFPEKSVYRHDTLQAVYFHQIQDIPISSTQIRQRLKNNRSISGMVPASVEHFIKQKGLYQS